MASEIDSGATGPQTPSGMLRLLRAQDEQALELKRRSESMAVTGARKAPSGRYLIGVISSLLPIPDLLHPIFEKVLIGVRGRLTANDCDLLLCVTRLTEDDESGRVSAAQQAIDRGVDGLIVWGVSSSNPEFTPIVESGLPTMFIDVEAFAARAGNVMSANVEGMAEIVDHLYETGRRRIAHISGHMQTRPGGDRLFGYRSELARLELQAPPEYVYEGDYFHESGYRAMKSFLALPEPPDAVTCSSDSMAIGAMAAIEEAGLSIPGDIAVTGFDDAAFAREIVPALTSMRQDALSMGTAAAEAVLRMLENPNLPPPVAVIPTVLVVRASSGART